jgi:lipopolysaccharide transport system ATP-binding protein
MSNTVISVENISKKYQLGTIGTGTFYGDLNRWWAKQRSRPDPTMKLGEADFSNLKDGILWALSDINFQVQQGDVLGIIGRNGAGKSTLLKILSDVTAPTSGEIKIKGRIASLLEVGTGFHPELTGRENVYLNGAILGMSRKEINRKFNEIVDFSGVEKFIDTPVKRYSSGMYVRLAFAVAAHLEPEILLLDEVLAVGDAQFQKKCLGKMGNVAKEGRTVVFISHNMIAIQSICKQTIWLDGGRLKELGHTSEIVKSYLRSGLVENNVTDRYWKDIESAPGNETVRLHRISVLPENGKPGDIITMETPVRIEVEYWNLLPSLHLHVTLHFYNDQRILAFTTGSVDKIDPSLNINPPIGLFSCVCHIPANLLNSGNYSVNLLLIRFSENKNYEMSEVIGFEVIDNRERRFAWFGREPGVFTPKIPWETKILDH